MGMEKFKAPRLVDAPEMYDPAYFNQLLRAIEIYFSQLDSKTPREVDTIRTNGRLITMPHALFYSTVNQTNAGITLENLFTFNNVDASPQDITLVSNSRITFEYAGTYMVAMQGRFANSANAVVEIDTWYKKGGTNIIYTRNRSDITARKSALINSHLAISNHSIIEIDDPLTEYLEVVWWAGDVGVSAEVQPVDASPTRPTVPSISLQIFMASRN